MNNPSPKACFYQEPRSGGKLLYSSHTVTSRQLNTLLDETKLKANQEMWGV